MSVQINTENPRSAPSVKSPSSIRAAAAPSDVFHTGHFARGCTFSHVYGTHSLCSCAFRSFHTGHFARGCTFSHVYGTHSLCSCAFRSFHTGHFTCGCTFSHVYGTVVELVFIELVSNFLSICHGVSYWSAICARLIVVGSLSTFHLKTQLLDAINPTTWSRCH